MFTLSTYDRDNALSNTNSNTQRAHLPDLDWSPLSKLPQCKLQIVHRLPNEEQDDEIRDEEGCPSILVGQLGKSPDISNSHRETDTGEYKLPFGSPVFSLFFPSLSVGLRKC